MKKQKYVTPILKCHNVELRKMLCGSKIHIAPGGDTEQQDPIWADPGDALIREESVDDWDW
ncbi:MAG: hypothetical protein Q3994_04215 [Prevotella sp.]|nr:hypothetical protein [Prevotella sp.]MDO4819566.1 hypothetical protein [Prevotella sp.]